MPTMTPTTFRLLAGILSVLPLAAGCDDQHGAVLADMPGKRAQEAAFSLPAPDGDPKTLVFLQWNVENLFDWEDDPDNKGDDEFTPKGSAEWTEALYRAKLSHLAELIAQSGADLVAVEEIENRRVLDDLAALLKTKYRRAFPHVLHRDGPDPRGIDVALLSRFPAESTRWLNQGFGRRETLAADFVISGARLSILVNHWKSQRDDRGGSTQKVRNSEADTVRAELERRFRADPQAVLAVTGDFNEDFTGEALTTHLGCLSDQARWRKDAQADLLFNLHATLPKDLTGTYYFWTEKTWSSLDSVAVSRQALAEAKKGGPKVFWRAQEGSYGPMRRGPHVDAQGRPLSFRKLYNQATKKREYQEGYADHLPVRLEWRLERRES